MTWTREHDAGVISGGPIEAYNLDEAAFLRALLAWMEADVVNRTAEITFAGTTCIAIVYNDRQSWNDCSVAIPAAGCWPLYYAAGGE